MVLFNYATRELTAKIVYYGPGLCGKTTNLQYIHENLPGQVRGKMLSLATKTDRTLFFDFLPIDLGEIRGMKTRIQLYTVPGQVFYNETRKLVLKGADGIVFVADSQEQMLGANVESFKNLEENLKAHGMRLSEMPHVIQFNKRDLPRLASIETLNVAINRYNAPFYESVATTGIGVQDTLKAAVKLVLLHLTHKYEAKPAASPAERTASAAARVPFVPSVAPVAPPLDSVSEPRTIPLAAPRALASPPLAATVGRASHSEAPRLAAIPLSMIDEQDKPVPPGRLPDPPDFRRAGGTTAEDLSCGAFGDNEIETLVGEVPEIYDESVVASPAGERWPESVNVADPAPVSPLDRSDPPYTGHESAWENGDGAIEGEETRATDPLPPSVADVPVVEPTGWWDEAPEVAAVPPPVEARAQHAWTPGAESRMEFEINREVDPEWDAANWEDPTAAEAPLPVEAPAARTPNEAGTTDEESGRSSATAYPPNDAAGPVLSEVSSDEDLFRDPNLEVARLASGELREIVVPVELSSDGQSRRFKLSIQISLQAVDGEERS